MGKIDIHPAEVHALGTKAREVANDPLKKAKKAMENARDDQGGGGDFHTVKTMSNLIELRYGCASYDVSMIHGVGDNLHASASAVEAGDIASADKFGNVK